MRRNVIGGILFCVIIICITFAACGITKQEKAVKLDPQKPTVVSVWHFYNAYAKNVFDEMVMEFNETVGLEKGIVIDAYGYGDVTALEDAVYNSANHIIGADELPHVFMAYPDSAYRADQLVPLAALDGYFTENEFGQYRREFLQEGVWDGSTEHKMIPVAKSTEVLYLNKTAWDKFSKDTGVSEELLQTWEGLASAAESYFKWSGGKSFLGFNSFNDFQMLAAAQLGKETYAKDGATGGFYYDKDVAAKTWEVCYVPHIKGWYSSNVYNQDGVKSGDLIAYIGSSAGAGFFPEMVTINDQESYKVQCKVLPYPHFQEGIPYISQRGAGMSILSSDAKHEYAAAQFLKWFTSPEKNLKFAVSTGYIPVQTQAIQSVGDVLKADKGKSKEAVRLSVESALRSMDEGSFYVRSAFEGSYELNALLGTSLFDKISADLSQMEARLEKGESKTAVTKKMLDQSNFEDWYSNLTAGIADKAGQNGSAQ